MFTHTIDLLVVLINYLLYTERFYMLNDSTDTTPEFTYQEVPEVVNTPTPSAPLEQALSNDGKERIAFEAYVGLIHLRMLRKNTLNQSKKLLH